MSSYMAVRHLKPGVVPGIRLWRRSSYTGKGKKWYYATLIWAALLVIL
jgi:hypothetical protein